MTVHAVSKLLVLSKGFQLKLKTFDCLTISSFNMSKFKIQDLDGMSERLKNLNRGFEFNLIINLHLIWDKHTETSKGFNFNYNSFKNRKSKTNIKVDLTNLLIP